MVKLEVLAVWPAKSIRVRPELVSRIVGPVQFLGLSTKLRMPGPCFVKPPVPALVTGAAHQSGPRALVVVLVWLTTATTLETKLDGTDIRACPRPVPFSVTTAGSVVP